MPDLLTHVGSGYVLVRFTKLEKKWFVLGCILPDLLLHLPVRGIRFTFDLFSLSPYPCWLLKGFGVLHEPVGYFLFCLWISLLWKKSLKSFTCPLLLGGVFHYGLDFLQAHPLPAYMPFFPFYISYMEAGLFSTEASLYLLPFWLFFLPWCYARDKQSFS